MSSLDSGTARSVCSPSLRVGSLNTAIPPASSFLTLGESGDSMLIPQQVPCPVRGGLVGRPIVRGPTPRAAAGKDLRIGGQETVAVGNPATRAEALLPRGEPGRDGNGCGLSRILPKGPCSPNSETCLLIADRSASNGDAQSDRHPSLNREVVPCLVGS